MRVAILGIGEVGSTLATDLMASGVEVSGWDPDPRNLPEGLDFAASNPDAINGAELILSTNLATVSVDVAREVLPYLQKNQVYADLNTASPATKQSIEQLFTESPAQFVDVAIMAPIAVKRIKTPLLVSGNSAAKFSELFSQFNSSITVLDAPAGQAATLKLIRSIFYKGLAAVVIEMLQAAEKLDLDSYAREQMMTILRDEDMIDRFVDGSRIHAKRRIHEMDAVIDLLQTLDVQSYSSVAARQHLRDLLEKESSE